MTSPGAPPPKQPDRAPARPVWLLWLIPMALLVGVVWFVLRGDRSGGAVADPAAAETTVPAAQ